MKIKEAIEIINGSTSTVLAKESNGFLHMYRRGLNAYNDWFLKMHIDATNWDSICSDWDCLSNIEPQDLARVMDVVQRLICTPVSERFPEKKYLLVIKRENPFCPKYVSNIITELSGLGFDLSIDEKEARIFSEKELNQIKKREPSLAPAIDAMKEPAEDKDE